MSRETLLDRFIRYARIDTQSDSTSVSFPSTEKQKDLLRVLVDDLRQAGLDDAVMNEHGYVMATLPSNLPPGHPAFDKVPVIGLLAHVDTYHEVSGAGVNPQVHHDYDGGEIHLPDGSVISPQDEPELSNCRGLTIITSDGTTLLGGDDKAGVAEILEVLWRYKENPSRLHGPIRVAFTPDEEIGRGMQHFDVKAFGARFAYTIDGSGLGEIEDETFSADSVNVVVTGSDVHPGYAKGKMVNAVRVMSELIAALPAHRAPETTEGREGYLHPMTFSGNVSETKAAFLVRDFTEEGLKDLEALLAGAARWIESKYPGSRVSLETKQSYRNMKQVLREVPHVVGYAEEAMVRAGLTPKRGSIRGGTDGARLSFMGIPTPNLFDGSMNIHSRKEWIALEWMEKAVETIGHLMDVWVEESAS